MPESAPDRESPTAIHFPFTHRQATRFRHGPLADEWVRQYPSLFDAANLRRRRDRPQAEFLKWRSALFIHQSLGRQCLIDDYLDPAQGGRHAQFRTRVGDKVQRLMRRHPALAPALFVFDPDGSDWFLASVQAHDEAPDATRRRFLAQLRELTGGRLLILQPDPIDAPAPTPAPRGRDGSPGRGRRRPSASLPAVAA
ncbi:MAG: hypothetical protein R3E68_22955 [Burkholderiaceae bacterium]